MRPVPILLALAVVLCFVSESRAGIDLPVRNYTAKIAGHTFGFIDWPPYDSPAGRERSYTTMYAGPLGKHDVPFTATQGLVGFCVLVVGMVALVTLFTFRWKRKRAT
jgi:hypothetical protein